MKKKIFWIGYVCFVAVLVLLGYSALQYVKNVLLEYEAAQPEKVMEQQMEQIKTAAANDTLEKVMTFQQLKQAEYDIDISDFREYKEKLKNAKELTYKIKNGYSETEQQFQILADNEAVALVTLESRKEEVKLAILTLSDWQVKEITPIITLANYDYTIEVPKGFLVTINGTELSNPQDAATEGWETYVAETLYSEPEIKIFDVDGKEALYDIVDNHVTPIVHTYSLKLPKGFSVSAGGRIQEGITEGEETSYSIITLHEVLMLTDTHGNRMEYRGGDSIYTYDYTVRIPDNFMIMLNGRNVENYKTSTEENVEYRYVAEYADMPAIVTYEIKEALCEPDIEIYDNLNQRVNCVFENYTFEQVEQNGLDAVPEDMAAKVDILEIAKMWSRLMTDDLEGSQHGFGTMKKYLIKDSYLYNVAQKWVTSIDITFTATHVLDNPPFSEENVTNYVSYGENLFSCDIYFVKHMDLVSRGLKVTDITNSTFYFMYYDETDDGKDNAHWVILDIQENLSE